MYLLLFTLSAVMLAVAADTLSVWAEYVESLGGTVHAVYDVVYFSCRVYVISPLLQQLMCLCVV